MLCQLSYVGVDSDSTAERIESLLASPFDLVAFTACRVFGVQPCHMGAVVSGRRVMVTTLGAAAGVMMRYADAHVTHHG